jgi:acyl carrier protein
MELNDFLIKFQDQFVDSSEIIINVDLNFREIESYDSLTGMAILVMIKDEFDLELADDEYKKLKSVREIYNYIQSKVN